MTEARSTVDLLTLIGQAIEQLQQSIDSFEASEQETGVHRLSDVIHRIDTYLTHVDEDPLLQMATLDPASICGTLHGIQDDLNHVIQELTDAPPVAHDPGRTAESDAAALPSNPGEDLPSAESDQEA